jgi:hypothetical protein
MFSARTWLIGKGSNGSILLKNPLFGRRRRALGAAVSEASLGLCAS